MEGLLRVFQDYGYEGATLVRLSEATGLEKSSLYHRFPGGKDEMAVALLQHVGERFANEILAPLRGSGPLGERIRKCAAGLNRFYAGGRRACVLDTLSLVGGDPRIRAEVKAAYQAWLTAFAEVGREAGLDAEEAEQRAQQAIGEIHGALIFARVSGRRTPFVLALERLEYRLASVID